MALTKVNYPDDDKLILGTGDDLEIYHDGSNSYIKDIGTGDLNIAGSIVRLQSSGGETLARGVENSAFELYYNNHKSLETNGEGLVIRGAEANHGVIYLYADEGDDNADMWSIQAKKTASTFTIQNNNAGAWDNSLKCHGDGAVELYYDNTKKFETTSTGIKLESGSGSYTPLLEINNVSSGAYAGEIRFKSYYNSTAYITGGIHSSGGSNENDGRLWLSTRNTKALEIDKDQNVLIPVDNNELRIGAGSDLRLYHDNSSSNSYIENDNASGALIVTSAQDIEISAADDWTIHGKANAEVELYYDGAKKFFTTSTGAEVSGYLNVTNTGLTAQIYHSGSGDTIGCVMRHGRGGLSGYAGKMIGFYGNDNTEEGSIVIGTSATAYNTSSDYRLKENEVAISDGITRSVSYTHLTLPTICSV